MGAVHDRASVIRVAIQAIGLVYPLVTNVGCFPHTLDHVGEHMCTPVLKEFVKGSITLFSRSPKSRLAWRTQTQLTSPSYSATRWWSWFEVANRFMIVL